MGKRGSKEGRASGRFVVTRNERDFRRIKEFMEVVPST